MRDFIPHTIDRTYRADLTASLVNRLTSHRQFRVQEVKTMSSTPVTAPVAG